MAVEAVLGEGSDLRHVRNVARGEELDEIDDERRLAAPCARVAR